MACLEWSLRFGRDAERWAEAERQGQEVPPTWTSRPRPHADLALVWEAFASLSKTRAAQVTPGGVLLSGISPTDVAAWLDLRGVASARRRREVFELVEAMDAVFLSWSTERGDRP
jgi:hypothetical protein